MLNVIDWIAIIFFGGFMFIIALTAFCVYAVMRGTSKDNFY